MAGVAIRGTRNPGSSPRRPFDYAAILQAFAAEGFHAASMDSVARRAKVAKPTLYRYYRSKEELFEAAVAVEIERLTAHLIDEYGRVAGRPLPEQIRIATGAYLRYAREHPALFELLFRTNLDRSSSGAASIEAAFERVGEAVAGLFRRELDARGLPAGQVADVLAAITVGAAELVGRHLAQRPEWNEEAVLDLITEMWSLGLGGASRRALAAADRPAYVLKQPRERG